MYYSAVEEYNNAVANYSEISMIFKQVRDLKGMARCVACTAADSRLKHTMFDSVKCQAKRTLTSA